MIENILTALGVATPTLAGVKAFFSLSERIRVVEAHLEGDEKIDDVKDNVLLVKLDAISDKIDLRCDSLDKRLERVERKVLNGEYHK